MTEHRLPTLRFLTCGSVDDGKSTLIGRLLYEQKLIFDDHMAALERDSRKHGTTGEDIDFALLVDGLEAEREQGITIDVAYRYFATSRRSFIVADTPGHEQYTRNMATGASNADLAILLVDARKGLLTQTHRHAVIASMLGIRHVVLAVNKIDLVGYSREAFERIAGQFALFAEKLSFRKIVSIPLSARMGDNVSAASGNMPWFRGATLLETLETIDVEEANAQGAFRLPVQWVNRPHLDFRGFAGTIAAGGVAVGDEVIVAASGRSSRVASILDAGAEVTEAPAGASVTVTLVDEIDVARGDLLVAPDQRPQVADQFAAHLIWMAEDRMLVGRSYLLKIGGLTIPATVTALKHRLDVTTLEKLAAKSLSLNEVALCNLSTSQPIAFDPYEANRSTGAFILIDRMTNATAAAGLIRFALRRATNIHRQSLTVTKQERARLKNQKPAIVWFTGLSGSGKSTIANRLEALLHERGAHTALLDGDNVRHGLNRDLGFTDADRVENIRRVGEVAKLMMEAGLIVLCSFISPFRAERRLVRQLAAEDVFLEAFVDVPLERAVARDPKGLYRRALAGEIKNFTGIDQPYEPPEAPELVLDSVNRSADLLAADLLAELERLGVIPAA